MSNEEEIQDNIWAIAIKGDFNTKYKSKLLKLANESGIKFIDEELFKFKEKESSAITLLIDKLIEQENILHLKDNFELNLIG